MTKNNVIAKQNECQDDFDFSEIVDSSYEDEMVSDAVHSMIEVSNQQMLLAIELTQLAIEKSTARDRSEDDIFSIFEKASGVIAENFPLKTLLEQFSEKN